VRQSDDERPLGRLVERLAPPLRASRKLEVMPNSRADNDKLVVADR
jgi:hypothetical protein